MPEIRLGEKMISENSPPYVIAEIGVNHEGSLERAKGLIRLAKEGNADAAKFQTYKAVTLAVKESPAYWDLAKEPTISQRDLFAKYDSFGESEYIELSRYSQDLGIDFLSTPFDDEAVDFLAPLMPFFKIASADLTCLPFLRKIASKGKPVVLSTGAATIDEVRRALTCIQESGCSTVALLHCILNYPTDYKMANLEMITDLRKKFPECLIGYSDHTPPDPSMAVLTTAFLKGARIIEKHFTDDKNLSGNDHYHAMDVNDLKIFNSSLSFIRSLEGCREKVPLPSEEIARRNARRSLVSRRAIQAGEVIDESALTYKRPGTGISPVEMDRVIGMKAVRFLKEDTILTWQDLSPS